ncbi:MAG: hypothetical protein ACXQTS_02665, partial [Candidatus Methanospirareceae archaeon]
MIDITSLRSFDLFPHSYSIFSNYCKEISMIGMGYSFEFTGIHDYVIVFYMEDGEITINDRRRFLEVYLPLKALEDQGMHILT